MTPSTPSDGIAVTGDRDAAPLDHDTAESHPENAAAFRRPRRRGVLIAALVTCAALLAGGGIAAGTILSSPASSEERDEARVPTSTTEIVQGELRGVTQAKGTLDYADKRAVGGASGIVTSVPAPGSTVGLGGTLYTVDNIPVLLLSGQLPAWRAFESGMADGPDVAQLENSLKALGYFDREPDNEFAASTVRAIERWQKALGLEQTGRLELGSVVFLPGDVRIASVDSPVGTMAGASVVTVTSLTKRVEVDLKLADQQLGVVGNQVEVQLPGGVTTTGTITDVGVPEEKESASGGKDVVIPLGVALDDVAAAASLQRASVTVGFPTEQRDGVLIVPVTALVALDGERFGVEIVDAKGKHHKVPVTTGLFADGQVEISGDGISAGQQVVVPA